MGLTEEEVTIVVTRVLSEQKRLHEDDIDDVVLRTVTHMLTSFGLEEEERKELRRDFQHLRRWRKSVEQAQAVTFKMAITAIIGGFIGAVWLGFKVLVGKGG